VEVSLKFFRLQDLPPYVLAEVDARKRAAVARGEQVFDFGIGNPDLPSPQLALDALTDAAKRPENHRYQPSPGLLPLRRAICEWYRRRRGVVLDPERECIVTIGSKEGLAHLFYAALGAGECVLVPDPCYPIHRYGVLFAGGVPLPVPIAPGRDPFDAYEQARARAPLPPVFAIMNFPHNPTTATVEADFWRRAVAWAKQHEIALVSDLAYADLVFDATPAPSILEVPEAREVAVEFFTISKSYSMPGWRVGFCVGNADIISALRMMKGYLDYGIFAPIQLAAAAVLGPEGDAIARAACETYRGRRDALVSALADVGWPVPAPLATMFLWAPLPARAQKLGAAEFARRLFEQTRVAVAPGTGFGPGGEGHVRFSLVEDADAIRTAAARIGEFLKQL
jgi:alanine-synthesizing transaminase